MAPYYSKKPFFSNSFQMGCCARVFLAGLLTTATALGQDRARDPVAAEALFRQGLDALKSDDWTVACQKFQKSFALDPAVSTQFKLGKCLEHDRLLASAWYAYELALKMNRESEASERRRLELEGTIVNAISALKPQVPTLHLVVKPAPPGLEIYRDGEPIALSLLGEVIPINPGQREIVARAPGYDEYREKLEVPVGRGVELVIALVPQRVTENAKPLAQPAEPVPAATLKAGTVSSNAGLTPEVSTGRGSAPFVWDQRHTGLAFTAVGAVTLGVAAYFGVRTLQNVSEMDDYKRDDGTYGSGVIGVNDKANTSQRAGIVLACVGGTLSGLGVTLYLTAKPVKQDKQRAEKPAVALRLSPLGVAAHGFW